MNIKTYKNKQEVALHFSNYLATLIASKKDIHIALSGGSTPKIVFDELSKNIHAINWKGVHFYWGDERCVPPTDSDSNYKMTVDHLIANIDIPKENIHRIKGENEPASEAERYSDVLVKSLPETNGLPQFDLVILGMGDDGHTASIFPHEIDLWHSDTYCEVANHPDSGQQRITITGAVINNATAVVFLVTGSNKAAKLKEIINKTGNYNDYPATLVNPTSKNLEWFLDAEAALNLD